MTDGQQRTEMPPLRPDDPREVAGYQLLRRIGEGGMGAVYLSRTRGGQPVAVKVIRGEYARDEEFRRRFQQEVAAARLVQGYHVVPVVDHDATGATPWLACRYVPGLALDEVLDRFGPLPTETVLQLIGCAAEALRAVHAAGVIHRDLKPGNVLLGADGPWVIDFGIARAADATQLTRSGGLIGTPQYMSPEHALGEPLTGASDVFSLGLIAAVAATGRHPYGDSGAITLATRIANTEARPPSLADYPAELRPLLERCLAADPADRATPAEIAALCEAAAGRPLRDFDRWLPPAPATAIAQREAAVQRALATDATLPPGYTPTVLSAPAHHPAPAAPPGHYAAAPTATAAPAPHPGYPPAPVTPPTSRRRRQRIIGAAVAAVVLAGVVYSATNSDKTPGTTGGQPTAGAPTGAHGTTPAAVPPAVKVRYGPAEITAETNSYLDLDTTPPVTGAQRGELFLGATAGAPTLTDGKSLVAIVKVPAAAPTPTPVDCAGLISRDGGYNIDDLTKGDRYCYRTPEGRMALLVVDSSPKQLDSVRFTVTVWEQSH
ncbi:serine/threonine protein kinase [Kitasatospora sp. MMS16-BH015]|uniref:serine/threonine-protein kinase n=1 Tax=Kitasatospora sp. MMS16-BH015 TaxID=2018025 RepID=UPI000CA34CB4|nr:serine/threonine-protein kinase [Kitasatospora sp. MMS16-BH015]AUG76474.1 serine/threonine protein kinase [Kitasatospora sp. MMS16-BH015]